jgi:hypothetical protein
MIAANWRLCGPIEDSIKLRSDLSYNLDAISCVSDDFEPVDDAEIANYILVAMEERRQPWPGMTLVGDASNARASCIPPKNSIFRLAGASVA